MSADILIVDDQPDNLRLLSSLLSQNGYRVRNAIRGERVFKAISKQIPDLILLDIKLPDVDGYEVCQRLKANENTRNIPIIFMSALHQVFDKVKAFEMGGVDYITKPFQVEEVLMRVGRQLQLSRQQEELKQQNQRLIETQKSLKMLLHAVSHDLRNPVVGMGLTLQGLLSQSESEVIVDSKILQVMFETCQRQLGLIEELTGTNVESETIDLNCECLSLFDLTQQLLEQWRSLFKQDRVTLNYQISRDLPKIQGDSKQLGRVFDNLIANALKYNPPGLILTLEAKLEANHIYCMVADNGVGIDPNLQLFEPYSRGLGVNQKPGLGLGLYI
jgi:two-component system, sensor histidine kinase and response regulator